MGFSNSSFDIPSYLQPFITVGSLLNLFSLILISLSLLLLSRIILSIIRIRKTLSTSYGFLEVKPTDRAEKTALSNTKLFEILHSLEKPYSWWERFIGIKKTISYEIVSSKLEGIRFVLRIPNDEIGNVRKTLLSFLPGVEIKEIPDYLSKQPQTNFKIEEFALANTFIYPLADQFQIHQHDSLSYLTGYLTKLGQNEEIALHFICTPIDNSTHFVKSHHVQNVRKKILSNESYESITSSSSSSHILNVLGSTLAFIVLSPITLISWFINDTKNPFPTWLFDSVGKDSHKNQGLAKNELIKSISNKVSQPLFEVQLRAYVQTANNTERSKGLLASFDSFSTAYQAITRTKNIFRFINTSFFKSVHYFLLKNRLIFYSKTSILSISELSSLYHLPHVQSAKTEDLLKVKSPKLYAPLSLKQHSNDFDITFAANSYGETITPIGVTLEERRRHTYIIGATGTGKTTLLLQMIYQDMQKGNGLAIIDPHGDLAERILGVIPKERIDDVVYFNPYDIEFPIGLNVLEIPDGLSEVELQREKDFITSTLISIFHKLYDARYSGPRMEHILRNVILTALEQDKPTLFTIYDLLTNAKYRKKVTGFLKDDVLKSFWKNEFEKLGSFQKAEQISPITNKLGRFLTTSMTRNILNQKESKLNFEDIMNNKKILICNLSKGKIGEDTAYFLGGLFTAKIQLTALRRVHIAEQKRPDFFLYIDEFQNFATMSFAQILSEARKYRLSVILAHQNTVQIENDLLETIIGNTGTLICFRTTSPKDEVKLLPVFAPEVEKGQIPNLPSYNFYMKINALHPQSTFSGEIENFLVTDEESIRNIVISNSQKKFGMPRHQVTVQGIKPFIQKLPKTENNLPSGNNFFEQVKS